MNQMKILKLAKILNKFTIDDIATTLELNEEGEKNAIRCLYSLIKKGLVKKVSDDQYQYLDKKIQEPIEKPKRIFQQPKITQKVIDVSKDENYQLYLNSSTSIKKRIAKYLSVIQAANGLRGKHLELFLLQWNEQFPEMKTSRSSFMRTRELILTRGLAPLLLNRSTPENNTKKQIKDVMYNYFKGYYLSYRGIPMTKAARLAVKKFKRLNPEMNCFKTPSETYFRKRLVAEYTKEEIKQFRIVKIKGVKQN